MGTNALLAQAIAVAWIVPVMLWIALGGWLVLCDFRARWLEFPTAALTAAADVAMVLIVVAVLFVVTFPVHTVPADRLRLTPGAEIYLGVLGMTPTVQLLGNLLLFAPFFALAPLRLRWLRGAGRVLALAAVVSVTVECAQYLLPFGRVASVDDVLLNTVGGLLGATLTRRWWPVSDFRSRSNGNHSPHSRYRLARLIAATTARSDAVMIELSTPTPQNTESPIAHST